MNIVYLLYTYMYAVYCFIQILGDIKRFDWLKTEDNINFDMFLWPVRVIFLIYSLPGWILLMNTVYLLYTYTVFCIAACPDGYWKCDSENLCMPDEWICDHETDCILNDGTVEDEGNALCDRKYTCATQLFSPNI